MSSWGGMAFRLAVFLLGHVLAAWATNEAGLQFLEEFKTREGVTALKSGLLYRVLKKGAGKHHPKKDSPCLCHYTGTTPTLTPNAIEMASEDWDQFDSSYKGGKPISFAPNQVIKAWTEAMQIMVEGDKWELVIPSELGYGEGGSGAKIKGGDVLIFHIEMIEITGGKVRAVKCNLHTREDCYVSELTLLDKWSKKSLDGLDAELKVLKVQLGGALKKEARETIDEEAKMIKQIIKAKSKGLEL